MEGPCIDGCLPATLDTMPLTERDKAILDLERTWWAEHGIKETAVKDRFELSSTRYYEILQELLESPDAMTHDPLLVRRLRRQRDQRRRLRWEGRAADEVTNR